MNNPIEGFVAAIAFIFILCVTIVMMTENTKYVKYDCRLVNISPDMPEDVKRMCRVAK